jgi:resuscitation-promoting factor RpfB
VRKKLAVVAVYGVVTAALIAGTTAYVSLDKTVHVSVDGQLTNVHSYARSVGDVLHREGIKVGEHDSLTPSATASVHDGSTITIERGRLLSLTIDGNTKQVWVTARSVDDALSQAGLRARGAVVSASRSDRVPLDGLSIAIDLPHTVTVQVDGSSHVLVSAKTTVADVLAEAGIAVKPGDRVSVPLQTRPSDGLGVIITRVTSGQVPVPSPVPFTTLTKKDSTLLVGTKKVAQQGKNGTLVRTYQLVFADGRQTAKALVSQQVTVQPVQQVVVVGTKPKPKPQPQRIFAAKADGLNWAALARCESGGRPGAVSGAFYGLYQFRVATWNAVGGVGLPSNASASEQTYRAQLLYQRSNWQTQWPVCGRMLFS